MMTGANKMITRALHSVFLRVPLNFVVSLTGIALVTLGIGIDNVVVVVASHFAAGILYVFCLQSATEGILFYSMTSSQHQAASSVHAVLTQGLKIVVALACPALFEINASLPFQAVGAVEILVAFALLVLFSRHVSELSAKVAAADKGQDMTTAATASSEAVAVDLPPPFLATDILLLFSMTRSMYKLEAEVARNRQKGVGLEVEVVESLSEVRV